MKDASIDIRKKEAIHKARITDWEIYNVDESEANRFIVRVVADVWISPLSKWIPTFYAKWKPRSFWTSSRSSERGTT